MGNCSLASHQSLASTTASLKRDAFAYFVRATSVIIFILGEALHACVAVNRLPVVQKHGGIVEAINTPGAQDGNSATVQGPFVLRASQHRCHHESARHRPRLGPARFGSRHLRYDMVGQMACRRSGYEREPVPHRLARFTGSDQRLLRLLLRT